MPRLAELMEMDTDELQAIIDRLVERGFLRHGTGGYGHHAPDEKGEFVYEEDWWDVTEAGRGALGLGSRRPIRHRQPGHPTDPSS